MLLWNPRGVCMVLARGVMPLKSMWRLFPRGVYLFSTLSLPGAGESVWRYATVSVKPTTVELEDSLGTGVKAAAVERM